MPQGANSMMRLTATTSNAQDLARNLLSKLTKLSPEPQLPQISIQSYSAIFGEQLHAAFHFPCTSGFAGTRWLSLPYFMAVAILPYGSVGYNFSSTGRAEARR